MKTVNIRNLSSRHEIIRLPHQEVCVKAGRCFCEKNGSSGTVHLPAKRLTTRIPEAILLATDMKRLLRGPKPKVKVSYAKDPPATAAASSAPATPEEDASEVKEAGVKNETKPRQRSKGRASNDN